MAWFVKIERGCVSKAEFDRHVPAHKAYVRDLIERGHAARTGYWAQKGGGMLLFRAESLEDAKTIVESDPLVIAKCVEYDLYEWVVVVE